MQRQFFNEQSFCKYLAETEEYSERKRYLALRGAEGDHLSERSEGGKLPEQKTRRPRCFEEAENPFKGVLRGGCKGGRAGGAAP